MNKRKIRYGRLFIVIITMLSLMLVLAIGSVHLIRMIDREQLKNREQVKFNVILNNECYELDYKESINFIKSNELPRLPSIEELKQQNQEPKLTYLGEFRLTGYCDCVECQEQWVGTTALGVAPTINHTIAVDPNVIHLGSHVMIDGIEYVAEDVGGMIQNNHIDIFVGSHSECFEDFCNKYSSVYLIK